MSYQRDYQSEAPTIREASLRNKADEATKYLAEAHNLLEALEDALRGPEPRPAGNVESPPRSGLRDSLFGITESAANVCSRLRSLIEDL